MKLVIKDNDTLVMALAVIAATMLVSTVIVEVLDLIDDAEAKKQLYSLVMIVFQ